MVENGFVLKLSLGDGINYWYVGLLNASPGFKSTEEIESHAFRPKRKKPHKFQKMIIGEDHDR
jgi:hypothetical protein